MKDRVNEKMLTDYVLGELGPEEEEEMERLIKDSAELQKEVEEIRNVTSYLTESFAEQPQFGLSVEQRDHIEDQTRGPQRRSSWRYKVAGGLAAACLVVVVYKNLPPSALEDGFSQRTAPVVQLEQLPRSTDIDDRSSTAADLEVLEDERGSTQETGQQPGLKKPANESPTQSALANQETPPATGNRLTNVRGEISDQSGAAIPGAEGKQVESFEFVPSNRAAPTASRMEQKVAVGVAGDILGGIREAPLLPADADFNTETYDRIRENEFTRVSEKPLSTFSIDVDTASYANVRRFLNDRTLPPKDAVRIEELVNYFNYDYTAPAGEHPFAAHVETAMAPWNDQHLLVRFGLKGREIDFSRRQPGNFVFLIDVSGSMRPANKLPLLKRALRLMVDKLNSEDRVAIAVYAGASGLVLSSTPCSEKEKILQSLERLEAGGSTNGGAGIELAYRVSEENLLKEGINRVILATDGDFNIGITNQGDLTRLIEEKAKSGIFLTVLGFGMGNYKDSTLEKLADRGNGNYAYIDTLQEARKVLVEEIGGTLATIAKDVKIQVEFNPAEVQAYRLVGYENRLLRDQDFNDDTKDAGEIGAGHTVTVLYELVPRGVKMDLPPAVDPLKYQPQPSVNQSESSGEMLTLKLRYKEPDGDMSQLIEIPVRAEARSLEQASGDFRFAASVAGFGMLLRDSTFKGNLNFDRVLQLAEESIGADPQGYRKDFVNLVKKARALSDLEQLEH
jgi:Ca-activated chloride channel family protein